MSQLVLLYSTGSGDDFEDRIDVECTGRRLTLDEAQERKLVTPDQLRRYGKGPRDRAWFEVESGDEVVFNITGWVGHDNESSYLCTQRLTYVIPPKGLPDPPVDLDETIFRRRESLHEYYAKHADQKR